MQHNSHRWKPIVSDPKMRSAIAAILNDLKSDLDDNLNLQNIPSFFFGSLSASLFYAYWSKYDEKKLTPEIQQSVYRLVETSIDHINAEVGISPSYVEGISGIAWAMNHLYECGLLDDEIEDCMVDFDQIVIAALQQNLIKANLDLLYGVTGNLNYLFARIKRGKIDPSILTDLVSQFEEILFDPAAGIIRNYQKHEILFGFAHGLSSLLVTFCKIADLEPTLADKCKALYNAVYQFISSFKMPESCSYTYSNLVENGKPETHSPLRWCHGELGLAVAFAIGGQTFNEITFKNEAVAIGLKTSQRRNLNVENVEEYGICHGTAGNAHLYARLYYYTQHEKFRETSSFWLEETLKMRVHEEGLAGFKVKTIKGDWVNSINLLNGVSGLGLTLISAITDLSPNWDNCLMLS